MLERGVRVPGPGTLAPLLEALELSESERLDLQQATWSTLPTSPNVEAPQTSASTLVGRVAEQAQIEVFLTRSAPALLVVGDAGIGKTRLLEDARRLAVARGITTLAAGSNPNPTSPPRSYAPLLDALSGFVHMQSPRRLRGLLHGCEWMARLLPELLEMGIVSPEVRLSAEQERRQIFRAVARFLTQSAGPGGALLVLDDLQSASTEALDLLAFLLSGRTRVRLLGAYRPGDPASLHPPSALVANLLHRDDLELIHLQPLNAADARQMILNLVPATTCDDQRVADAVRLSEGVPLYLVCFARSLRGELIAEAQNGGAPAASPRPGLPTGLVEIVRRQLAYLPAGSHEVLRATARYEAPAIHRAELLAVTHQPEATLQSALEHLVGIGLLREVEPNVFRVNHQVVRLVAASVSPAWSGQA
jgi:predicted ATPase